VVNISDKDEVNKFCLISTHVIQNSRKPYYTGDYAGDDDLNPSHTLVMELTDVNDERDENDKVYLSYMPASLARNLNYYPQQDVEPPPEFEDSDVEEEIIEMIEEIVSIVPAHINADTEERELVKAAQRKNQDEVQDIVIVETADRKHIIEGELQKQKLQDALDVKTPQEMLEEFIDDENCSI
jgi:hypothetical protein